MPPITAAFTRKIGSCATGNLSAVSVAHDKCHNEKATLVHKTLGLSPDVMVYDISNACLGFLNGMVTLANMIELGQIRAGLVVGTEGSRQLVETTIDAMISGQIGQPAACISDHTR